MSEWSKSATWNYRITRDEEEEQEQGIASLEVGALSPKEKPVDVVVDMVIQ